MAELQLYEKKIIVADTVLKLEHLFYANMDAETNQSRSKAVEEKIR